MTGTGRKWKASGQRRMGHSHHGSLGKGWSQADEARKALGMLSFRMLGDLIC